MGWEKHWRKALRQGTGLRSVRDEGMAAARTVHLMTLYQQFGASLHYGRFLIGNLWEYLDKGAGRVKEPILRGSV